MYVFDANVFIEAHQRYYGLDFAPGFWEHLIRGFAKGQVVSIEKVAQELAKRADPLSQWAQANAQLFLPMDSAVQDSFQKLSAWAMDPQHKYTPAARNEFLQKADYQLVAYAHAHGYAVVTHEEPSPDAKKRVKIPDACVAFNVPWINTFTMLRNNGARFVLSDEG